jgi:hypothetical protein
MDAERRVGLCSSFPCRGACGSVALKNFLTMKPLLDSYIRQPSTWLGLAKLGAAMGFYSSGVGGAVGSAIVAIFGLIDVIRNERK